MSTGHTFMNGVSCPRQKQKENKENMENTVVLKFQGTNSEVNIETLPGGTIVSWNLSDKIYGGYYVVVAFKNNSAGIAGISLKNGGYLDKGAKVTVVPPGTVLELTTGSAE